VCLAHQPQILIVQHIAKTGNVEAVGIAGTKMFSKSITKNTNSKKGGDYILHLFFGNKNLKVLPLL